MRSWTRSPGYHEIPLPDTSLRQSLEIDIEVAKAQSNENPVFYVQYAHARINSIFEKAKEAGVLAGEAPAVPDSIDASLYNDDEYRLIRKLCSIL